MYDNNIKISKKILFEIENVVILVLSQYHSHINGLNCERKGKRDKKKKKIRAHITSLDAPHSQQ